jgi:hypothetical protein
MSKITLTSLFSLKFFQMGHHLVISERKCIIFNLFCPKHPILETYTCTSYGQKSALSSSKRGKISTLSFPKGILKANATHLFSQTPSSNSCLIPEAKLGPKILHQQLETSMYTKPSWSSAAACLQNDSTI